ncbi:hypothetical protein ACFOQM_18620 [Paenibacillus sp. GCM10012307]|uniref:Uncharacterized protein n=1 Tax=Paenibacillus roseus TaxID=2798579 RepID=A0A934MQJ9_9BACL|nr:hypothetical protein [Paenibacillus roseus]MBJ6363236.1 hypothetical protein [Paenibacillus roseus]
MRHQIDPKTQLKYYFPVKEPILTLNINELRRAAYSDDNKKTVSLMIGALRRRRYLTIEDLLNTTWKELGSIRNFGITCQLLLFDFLERISEHPEYLISLDAYERSRKLEAIKGRLREMGMIL